MELRFGLGRDPMVEFKPEPGLAKPLGLTMLDGLGRELGFAMAGFTGSALLLPAGRVRLLLGLSGFSLFTPTNCG